VGLSFGVDLTGSEQVASVGSCEHCCESQGTKYGMKSLDLFHCVLVYLHLRSCLFIYLLIYLFINVYIYLFIYLFIYCVFNDALSISGHDVEWLGDRG
jgi:hypothetical protein